MTSNLSRVDPARRAAVRALLLEEVTSSSTRPSGGPAPAPRSASPQRRSTRRRVVVALVSVAAVAVTAAAMLAGDPTAPASYASWTAAPAARPAPAVDEEGLWARVKDVLGVDGTASQASQCESLTGSTVGIEGVPRREREAARRSVLVDRRGDWTFCVDVIKGSGTASDPLVVMDGLTSQKPLPPDDDGVSVVSSGGATVWDEPYAWPTGPGVGVLGGSPFAVAGERADRKNYSLIGAAGPDVRGVSIDLDDGTVITTTLHGDFWAAWWPGRVTTARVDTLTVTTSTGDRYEVDPRTIGLPWERAGASTVPWP